MTKGEILFYLKFTAASIFIAVVFIMAIFGISRLPAIAGKNPLQGTASLSSPGPAAPSGELGKVLRLPPGQKLVQYNYVIGNGNVGHDLTYLTRKMRPGEQPESYRLVHVDERFADGTKNEHVILIEEQLLIAEPDHTWK